VVVLDERAAVRANRIFSAETRRPTEGVAVGTGQSRDTAAAPVTLPRAITDAMSIARLLLAIEEATEDAEAIWSNEIADHAALVGSRRQSRFAVRLQRRIARR